jgi:hypothetical protein
MPLTMRPTGLASPAYAHLQDWTVLDDGGAVGRLYEDGSLSTPPELRWFWSVVVYVPPAAGIVTSGKVPTLEGAKAQFEAALRQWLEWAKLSD